MKSYTPEMLKEYFECERTLLELIIDTFLPRPEISLSYLSEFGFVLYANSSIGGESSSSGSGVTNGCGGTNSSSSINLEDLGVNFAKNCLNLLFKAASADQIGATPEKSAIFLPFLLNRCRATLVAFVDEQKFTLGSFAMKP